MSLSIYIMWIDCGIELLILRVYLVDGAMYLAPTCTVCLALLKAALIVIDCMVIMLI